MDLSNIYHTYSPRLDLALPPLKCAHRVPSSHISRYSRHCQGTTILLGLPALPEYHSAPNQTIFVTLLTGVSARNVFCGELNFAQFMTSLVLLRRARTRAQGYFAHKKRFPRRTQQQAYVWGPLVVLGGGGLFRMSKVPLCGRLAVQQISYANKLFIFFFQSK
jgi:hypothetical protein